MSATEEPRVFTRPPRWKRDLKALRQVLLRRPSRIFGTAIVLVFVFMGLFGQSFYPKKLPIDPDNLLSGPSKDHWLGTDFAGTDVLSLIHI